jgi:hypothetical protein
MRVDDFCELTAAVTVGTLESVHPSGFIVMGQWAAVYFPPSAPIVIPFSIGAASTAAYVQASPAVGGVMTKIIELTCNTAFSASFGNAENDSTLDAIGDTESIENGTSTTASGETVWYDIDSLCHIEDDYFGMPEGNAYLPFESDSSSTEDSLSDLGPDSRDNYVTEPEEREEQSGDPCPPDNPLL